MPHPVLGLPNSKFRQIGMRGMRNAISSSTDAGGNGVKAGGTTFIGALRDNEVAIIQEVVMECIHDAAATNNTLTWTFNSGTLVFVSRGSATSGTRNRYNMKKGGSLVVLPNGSSAALVLSCSADAGWQVRIRYQKMRQVDAIANGYMPGVPFIATCNGNGVAAGTPVDLITSATVTKVRGLEVRGFAITGAQTNAASAAIKTITLDFWDGTTQRKVFKNCYALNNILASPQTVVSQCRIRGPKGATSADPSFGMRATFGEQALNAAVSVWGFFYTDDQKTWPGTGVPPAAVTDPCNGGETFWLYSESVVNPSAANWFPTTTIPTASGRLPFVIDGVAASIGLSTGNASMLAVGYTDTPVKTIIEGMPVNATTAASAASFVREDVNIRLNAGLTPAFSHRAIAGATDACSILAWGRFGGEGITSRDDETGAIA